MIETLLLINDSNFQVHVQIFILILQVFKKMFYLYLVLNVMIV